MKFNVKLEARPFQIDREIHPRFGRSPDLIRAGANSDEVGPTGRRYHTAKYRIFGLGLYLVLGAALLASGSPESPGRLWAEAVNGGKIATKDTAVRINDKAVRLIWDTGTGFPLVLFEHAAKRLGLRIVVPPKELNPGQVILGETEGCRTVIFGETPQEGSLAVASVPEDVRVWKDETMDGVLGWPLMRTNIWGFFISDRDFYQIAAVPALGPEWSHFEIPDDADTLSLRVANDTRGIQRVLVDTGNSDGILLPPDQWRAWREANPTAPITLQVSYIAGAKEPSCFEESWAEKFTIGSLVIENVPIREADSAYYLTFAKPGEKIAALGLAAIERIELIVDAPNSVAHARTGTTPAPGYSHNRLGAAFIPKGNDLVVRVAPGSPAAIAGLRDGDILLKVDGYVVSKWKSDPRWHKYTRGDVPVGTTRVFTVRRGSSKYKISVVARDILAPPVVATRS